MPVPDLHDRLAKLNDLVDPEHARKCDRLFEDAVTLRPVEHLPRLRPEAVQGWPTFPYSEAFEDMEKMLVNELAGVWQGASIRDDRPYTIRANYGVGTVASLFGCHCFLTMDNMPWCEPLSDEGLRTALDHGVPDLSNGLGSRVFETERFYKETLAQYPNLREAVHIFVCDTQGPMDIAHLVMGHRIYTEIYDDPELVHRLLDLATSTYIAFTRAQKEIIGEGYDWHWHSQMKIRGSTRICEDTPTNLSPDSYMEFCRPYNVRAVKELGGGWIHFCGSGFQIVPLILDTPGLTGINLGNPERHNMRKLFDEASSRGVPILAWSGPFTPDDAAYIKTGVTLIGGGPTH